MINLLTNTSLAAPGALANRLQCRTDCKFQNNRHWVKNVTIGSENHTCGDWGGASKSEGYLKLHREKKQAGTDRL